MKKGVLIAIIAIVVILIAIPVSTYNGMVSEQENVNSAYSNIEAQLQRRADLIPNLVNSVKGYMQHEEKIINSITEAREKLVNAHGAKETADANEALTQALSNFNVIVENYPDLKANENFIQLQDELAGTENRIAVARKDYNEIAKSYNGMIRRIPGVFFASMFGFDPAEYFEASESSHAVPGVDFSGN
ncbi:MAG: LemA family protein [Clostridia bacterium]|nr:LemA family protein [Clostridia bacterium]